MGDGDGVTITTPVPKKSKAELKLDASNLMMEVGMVEGVEGGKIFDLCPEIVKKIKKFLARDGVTKAATSQQLKIHPSTISILSFTQLLQSVEVQNSILLTICQVLPGTYHIQQKSLAQPQRSLSIPLDTFLQVACEGIC